MTRATTRRVWRPVALAVCALAPLSGCAWQGVNSLPLPGAPGRVAGATVYHAEFANVGTLESNSPVLIDDVVVGSVGPMKVVRGHAEVDILVKPGVVVPGNAVAKIGQTSLLGSTHVELDPVPGTAPAGRLAPGTTIPLNQSSTYPSTERTLAALATVVDGGGVGQIGGIIHSFNNAFDGRQESIRDLIGRLDRFVGTVDDQRDDIVTTIRALNGLVGTFAGQRDAITEALRVMPQALEVLVAQRPNITAALTKLRTFSDTATSLINDTKSDLVENLRHMEPITRSLADVGIVIDKAIAMATVFPYGQAAIDRYIKGDYLNLSATLDLTLPRIRRELWMGTRFGDPTQGIQAAIGDPGYAEQTKDPLGIGIAPPPAVIAPRPPDVAPPPLPGPAPAPAPDQGGH